MVNNKAAVCGTDYIRPAASNETGANKATANYSCRRGIEDKTTAIMTALMQKDSILFRRAKKNNANYYLRSGNASSSQMGGAIPVKCKASHL
jgi:hypothetical protein